MTPLGNREKIVPAGIISRRATRKASDTLPVWKIDRREPVSGAFGLSWHFHPVHGLAERLDIAVLLGRARQR
jgi:hypothetical protein